MVSIRVLWCPRSMAYTARYKILSCPHRMNHANNVSGDGDLQNYFL